jgi:hypothetical protein
MQWMSLMLVRLMQYYSYLNMLRHISPSSHETAVLVWPYFLYGLVYPSVTGRCPCVACDYNPLNFAQSPYCSTFCKKIILITVSFRNGSFSEFHYFQVINAFSSCGTDECLSVIKLSKIPVDITGSVSRHLCLVCSIIHVSDILLVFVFSLFRFWKRRRSLKLKLN